MEAGTENWSSEAFLQMSVSVDDYKNKQEPTPTLDGEKIVSHLLGADLTAAVHILQVYVLSIILHWSNGQKIPTQRSPHHWRKQSSHKYIYTHAHTDI